MSEDTEGCEDSEMETWKEYVLDGFVGLSFLIGAIVAILGGVWLVLQLLIQLQTLLSEAHTLLYTLTNPLLVGVVYGIVLSYVVYRGRERWGDRIL